MKKIKKGDEVIIITGKDRGKRGKVDRVFTKSNKVLIPGLNVYKRHLKRRDEKNPGGIIDFSRTIPISNVKVICPKCNQPTRVGFEREKTEKHRICKKCSQII